MASSGCEYYVLPCARRTGVVVIDEEPFIHATDRLEYTRVNKHEAGWCVPHVPDVVELSVVELLQTVVFCSHRPGVYMTTGIPD